MEILGLMQETAASGVDHQATTDKSLLGPLCLPQLSQQFRKGLVPGHPSYARDPGLFSALFFLCPSPPLGKRNTIPEDLFWFSLQECPRNRWQTHQKYTTPRISDQFLTYLWWPPPENLCLTNFLGYFHLEVPKPGCFKTGGLQFLRGSALLHSFAPFSNCTHLQQTCVCAHLRSFTLICVFLRTTAFGNFHILGAL